MIQVAGYIHAFEAHATADEHAHFFDQLRAVPADPVTLANGHFLHIVLVSLAVFVFAVLSLRLYWTEYKRTGKFQIPKDK